MPAEGDGDSQTLICVLVARPRWCLTLSNPVPWQNWMAVYLGYTLRMKTLLRGWPVMVHDTHTRRSADVEQCWEQGWSPGVNHSLACGKCWRHHSYGLKRGNFLVETWVGEHTKREGTWTVCQGDLCAKLCHTQLLSPKRLQRLPKPIISMNVVWVLLLSHMCCSHVKRVYRLNELNTTYNSIIQ